MNKTLKGGGGVTLKGVTFPPVLTTTVAAENSSMKLDDVTEQKMGFVQLKMDILHLNGENHVFGMFFKGFCVVAVKDFLLSST